MEIYIMNNNTVSYDDAVLTVNNMVPIHNFSGEFIGPDGVVYKNFVIGLLAGGMLGAVWINNEDVLIESDIVKVSEYQRAYDEVSGLYQSGALDDVAELIAPYMVKGEQRLQASLF
jgi:hypothetical protein